MASLVFSNCLPQKDWLNICFFLFTETPAQLSGALLMAPQAECLQIRKIAFASAFHYRQNMIRIPKAAALCVHIEPAPQCSPFLRWHPLETPIKLDGIQAAERANPLVARQHPIAQIGWICPQPPLVDAAFRAEGPSPFGHFRAAPSTNASPMRPALFGAPNPAAGAFSLGAHFEIKICRWPVVPGLV
jgi:hypothetical protein